MKVHPHSNHFCGKPVYYSFLVILQAEVIISVGLTMEYRVTLGEEVTENEVLRD